HPARVERPGDRISERGHGVRIPGQGRWRPRDEATENNEAGHDAPQGPLHHPLSHLRKAPSRDRIAARSARSAGASAFLEREIVPRILPFYSLPPTQVFPPTTRFRRVDPCGSGTSGEHVSKMSSRARCDQPCVRPSTLCYPDAAMSKTSASNASQRPAP